MKYQEKKEYVKENKENEEVNYEKGKIRYG